MASQLHHNEIAYAKMTGRMTYLLRITGVIEGEPIKANHEVFGHSIDMIEDGVGSSMNERDSGRRRWIRTGVCVLATQLQLQDQIYEEAEVVSASDITHGAGWHVKENVSRIPVVQKRALLALKAADTPNDAMQADCEIRGAAGMHYAPDAVREMSLSSRTTLDMTACLSPVRTSDRQVVLATGHDIRMLTPGEERLLPART